MKTINLTFDLDDDFFEKTLNKNSLNKSNWDGFNLGIPKILKLIDYYEKKFKILIKSTWFIRIDKSIEKEFGDSCFFLKKFIKKYYNKNLEIAWHPHIYENYSKTKFEKNENKILTEMDYIYKKILEVYPSMKSFRMGGMYLSNNILNFLERNNFKYDSSSFPGRSRNDETFCFDWLEANKQPYFPSKKNLKKTNFEVNKNFKLIEVPLSTIDIKANYDKKHISRYIDLSYDNKFIKKQLTNFVLENDHITLILHPCCILDNIFKKHGLIKFGIKNFSENIEMVINTLNSNSINYKFKKISEVRI